jgi:hypothetical protein
MEDRWRDGIQAIKVIKAIQMVFSVYGVGVSRAKWGLAPGKGCVCTGL